MLCSGAAQIAENGHEGHPCPAAGVEGEQPDVNPNGALTITVPSGAPAGQHVVVGVGQSSAARG